MSEQSSLRILAPAKLNLRLKVTGRRADGYHDLSMLNAAIDLADEIAIEFTEDEAVSLSEVEFGALLPPGTAERTAISQELFSCEKNLMLRAALYCKERFRIREGMRFHLRKNIPIGAGLGGGSSDAGAVIRHLAKRAGINFDRKSISECVSIGSDVPYACHGGLALVSGIGENVESVPAPLSKALHGAHTFLIHPQTHVPTPQVYEEYRRITPVVTPKQDLLLEEFLQIRWDSISRTEIMQKLFALIENDLEEPFAKLFPEIGRLLNELREFPGWRVGVSGSGCTLFAISTNQNSSNDTDNLTQITALVGTRAKISKVHFQ